MLLFVITMITLLKSFWSERFEDTKLDLRMEEFIPLDPAPSATEVDLIEFLRNCYYYFDES